MVKLYSNWLLPKPEEPVTSARVITEEELAERRLKNWCEDMEDRMKANQKEWVNQ